jgi:hypothetical protein
MIIVMNLVTIKAMDVATMDCYLLIHEANSFKKNKMIVQMEKRERCCNAKLSYL